MLINDFMLLSCVRINDYDDSTLAKWPFPQHGVRRAADDTIIIHDLH